jgi:hypothetical protein
VLQSLRIRNFKAWADTGRISLAPLTLLFGPNSSGKSSLNHFLMLLRQTVRSPDRNAVLDFGDASSPVRLGGFRDAVFGHDLERTIDFELEWRLDPQLTVRDPRSGKRFSGDSLHFEASVHQLGRARAPQSEGLTYSLRNKGEDRLTVDLVRDEKRQNRWRLESEGYTLVRGKGRAWELPKPVQFYGFPSEAQVYFQNTAFLSDLELAFQQHLERLSYLGPLRSPPERLYSWSGVVPQDVGWQGESAVQAILASGQRALNFKPGARLRPFRAVVGQWLEDLGLLSSFNLTEVAPDRDLYEVRVRAQSRSEEVALSDVGFGVSQVLPVVTQVFYAPPSSTVLIEQPELHLHPAAQSALGDLLIDAIQAREDAALRGVQLIV